MKRNCLIKKYIPLGILLQSLAIILNQTMDMNDFTLGILHGSSIAILLLGIYKNRCVKNKN